MGVHCYLLLHPPNMYLRILSGSATLKSRGKGIRINRIRKIKRDKKNLEEFALSQRQGREILWTMLHLNKTSLSLKHVKEPVENSSKSLSDLVFCQIFFFIFSHHCIILQSGDSILSPFKACSSNETGLIMLICQQEILMQKQYIYLSMANPGYFFLLKL